jgi:glycosyltransferase involved in cell wall biosynthesis
MNPHCQTAIPVVVAIPAMNEEEELPGCLRALNTQQGAAVDAVVLCLNNCADRSAEAVLSIADQLDFALHVIQIDLPPHLASAGVARRIAMERAAELAGPLGVILTTDADGRVDPDWLKVNLAAIRSGAEAVAGRATIEPNGAKLIPAYLHEMDARECAYAALLDEIRSLVDPDQADPWPRHDEHSGASIAVTVAAYRRAGGMPAVTLAEDRAFFDALRRVDAHIRHEPDANVVVSARTVGRAAGGMADTIRKRIEQMDQFLDDRLEPVRNALRRNILRQRLKRLRASHSGLQLSMAQPVWHRAALPAAHISAGHEAAIHSTSSMLGADIQSLQMAAHPNDRAHRPAPAGARKLAAILGVRIEDIEQAVSAQYFGDAWATLEDAASTALPKVRVRHADLPQQLGRARRLRDALRAAALVRREANPIGTAFRAAAE